jgi:hypothetical protein
MQNEVWIALLQRLPRSLHDSTSLVTKTGVEIAIQSIIRVEENYLVIRGRLAGTQEGGRAFFIPYDQLDFVMSQRPMAEVQIAALFSSDPTSPGFAAELPPPPPEAALPEPEAEPAPLAEPPSFGPADQTPSPAPSTNGRSAPSKKNLLDRLRARSTGSNPGRPSR